MHSSLFNALLWFVTAASVRASGGTGRTTACIVQAGNSNVIDDAPAILQAFRECGQNGRIVFQPVTYYVNSVMNVTWLDNVDIDLQGTLLVRAGRPRASHLLNANLITVEQQHSILAQ